MYKRQAHDAGRAACRSNRSVLAAISSTWPCNSSVYLCVASQLCQTVGRSELRLEANSTSRTRKFVVSLKISVLLSQTGLGQFCHGTSIIALSPSVSSPFMSVAHLLSLIFPVAIFFCSLKYRCRSFRTVTLCCPFFLPAYLLLPSFPVAKFSVAHFSGCRYFLLPFFRCRYF